MNYFIKREIKSAAKENGIILPDQSTLIRSVMQRLPEKDPHIKKVERGKNEYIEEMRNEKKCMNLSEIEEQKSIKMMKLLII